MIDATAMTTPDADSYLENAWRSMPWGAGIDDNAYWTWEAEWDRLARDAELGIPAAVEALAVVDREVRATIARLRDETTPKLCR